MYQLVPLTGAGAGTETAPGTETRDMTERLLNRRGEEVYVLDGGVVVVPLVTYAAPPASRWREVGLNELLDILADLRAATRAPIPTTANFDTDRPFLSPDIVRLTVQAAVAVARDGYRVWMARDGDDLYVAAQLDDEDRGT